MIACFALSVAITLVLRQTMVYMNKKKDRSYGAAINEIQVIEGGDIVKGTVEELQIDETDWNNKDMRYLL